MPTFNDARVRAANERLPDSRRTYVLYWMQASRRLDRNHALDDALHWSRHLQKPLVVYEGLRLDYPWACARHHHFMLEGMLANRKRAAELGINYWPYVETPDQPARGLLRRIAKNACLVVTDDYPAFIVPEQIAALAARIDVALHAIDGNGLIPLAMLGAPVSAAAHLRPRIHRLFAEAWHHRAASQPEFEKQTRVPLVAPFSCWTGDDVAATVAALPLDQSVRPVPRIMGGQAAGREILRLFIRDKLPRYAEGRNCPDDPQRSAASGLSAHLRHGHLSIQEIAEAVLGSDWTPERLQLSARNKREGYFHEDANVNAFLDEAITWRDIGYHYFRQAGHPEPGHQARYYSLDATLPAWAKATLSKHANDPREYVYSLEEWEAGDTHDPLWNAAQQELVATGRIHNYLRMVWGKKVLQWSSSPDEAYAILEHLNNKYALDGRDPNSYTGILWCFGMFDRPWPPERSVFGSVRYMSSENTAKKFRLDGYYEYVAGLQHS